MARFYSNENFPQQVVEALRALGHDVETSHDAGNSGTAMPDERVLAHAVRSGRVLLTLNRRHFVALHGSQPAHHGIVVCTFDPDFNGQAQRVHLAVGERGDCKSLLIRVNRQR